MLPVISGSQPVGDVEPIRTNVESITDRLRAGSKIE